MAQIRLSNTKKKTFSAPVKFILPAEASVPETSLDKFTMLLYGEQKIGKTSLASCFPSPYFMMFEFGGKALKIRQSMIPDWDTALAASEALCANKGYCKTVVIDTGFKAYAACYHWVLKKLDIDSPGEDSWGFWQECDKEFQRFHDELIWAGFGLIATAHCDEEDITKRGFTTHYTTPQLGKQASRYYTGGMDILLYYHYDDNGNRLITIRGDAFRLAGTRTKGKFLYTDGTLIKEISAGNSEEEAYKNLLDAYNCKLNNPEKKGGLKLR